MNYFDIDHKLARGLVREELRPLKQLARSNAHVNISKYMHQLANKARRGDKFSQPHVNRIQNQVVRLTREHFGSIAEFKRKGRIEEYDTKWCDAPGFLYFWSTSHVVFQLDEPDLHYDEEMVELRYQRFMGDRRRLVIDDLSCNLFIGQHSLQRLLERGGVTSRPLKTVGENIAALFGLSILYTIAFKAGKLAYHPQVVLPFGNGLFLCKIALAQDDADLEGFSSRFRLRTDPIESRSCPSSLPDFFGYELNGLKGRIVVQVSTYIGVTEMSTEQYWAHHQINKALEKHKDSIDSLLNLIIAPEMLTGEIPKKIRDVIKDMDRILTDHRWEIATSK